MELIGISGYARSGKDEAAKVLVEKFGFRRVAFADKLREFLYALNPIIGYGKESLDKPYVGEAVFVNDVIDAIGWDGYKETGYSTEIRRLLQRLGTEAGRDVLWDSIWIDATLTNMDEGDRIVITDCRFPNEARAVREAGGQLWRIDRWGVGPANQHPSETSLDDYDFDRVIFNGGTLEEYRDKVVAVYENRFKK